MKKITMLILLFISLFFFVGISNTKAVTKQDIITLSGNVKTCSSKTKALVKGYMNSYSRLLNERDVSDENLNKIYNNINRAISILNSNNICSTDQKDKVPESVKNTLYALYEQTSSIISSSPKYSDNKTTESNMVVDSVKKEIKVYDNGVLVDVIKVDEKLNYVGLNKVLIAGIVILSITFVALFVLAILKKYNVITVGLMYLIIIALPVCIIFRNEISLGLDAISTMSFKESSSKKNVQTDGKKIISYPSYGDKYATMYVFDKKGDVFFGDSSDVLKKGIGQSSASSLPGEGKTTVLSGHNTGLFSNLFELKLNDVVDIETVYGNFKYKIEKIETIKNTDTLKEDYDLVLYTCSPNKALYGNKRLVLYAKLVESKWIGDSNEK